MPAVLSNERIIKRTDADQDLTAKGERIRDEIEVERRVGAVGKG